MLNHTDVGWHGRARALLLRKLIHQFAPPSARSVCGLSSELEDIVIGDWRLARTERGADILIVESIDVLPQIAISNPNAHLIVLNVSGVSRREAVAQLRAMDRATGFDIEEAILLHYGFLVRLCFFFPGGSALLEKIKRLSRGLLASFLAQLMRFETLFLPYVRFLFGMDRLIIARRVRKMPPQDFDLSVVIPAYNEEARVADPLRSIEGYLNQAGRKAEIITVDDGSTDATARVVQHASSHIRLIPLFVNSGKGAAVREGVLHARGQSILVSDADGATPIEELERLEPELRDGADIAIGSRYLQDSRVMQRQPFFRRLVSRIGNLLIRIIAGLPFYDTQCGFKLFRREAAWKGFAQLINRRFGYDFEVLRRSQRARLKISEVPVAWHDREGSKVRPVDLLNVLLGLIRVRFNYIIRFAIVGVMNTAVNITVHNALWFVFGFGSMYRQVMYQSMGFLVANVFSFLVNSSFTFQKHGDYWKFFVISALVFASALAAFHAAQVLLAAGANPFLVNVSIIAAVPVNFLVNYFGYKLLVYRVRN